MCTIEGKNTLKLPSGSLLRTFSIEGSAILGMFPIGDFPSPSITRMFVGKHSNSPSPRYFINTAFASETTVRFYQESIPAFSR
jgi:hypothetical protein